MSVEIKTLSGMANVVMLNKLRAVALGRSTELPRMRVIARLPSVDPDAYESLTSIASDAMVQPRLRRMAVSSLGRLKKRPLDTIQRYVMDSDIGVAITAVKILGRVGDVNSLTSLDQAVRHPDIGLQRYAFFASALIAHRFNLSGYELPSVKSATYLKLPPSALSVKVRAATIEEDRLIKSTLSNHPVTLPISLATWDLECCKKRLALVLDQSLLSPWKPDEFSRRKLYLGQLAMYNQVTASYSPGLSFLVTSKGGGQLEVGMYRSSGQLIYGGEGQVNEQAMRFVMQSTDMPGASATLIEGSYGPQTGLNLKIKSSAMRTQPALNPTPVAIG